MAVIIIINIIDEMVERMILKVLLTWNVYFIEEDSVDVWDELCVYFNCQFHNGYLSSLHGH